MSAKYCPYCGKKVWFEKDIGFYVCKTGDALLSEYELLDEPKVEDNNVNNSESVDEIPEGCRACGGPYPYCKTSCSIFDD